MKFVHFFSIIALIFAGPAFAQSKDAKADEPFSFDFAGYPEPGPIQVYKGKMLVGSKHSDVKNEIFFKTLKFAIDKTEALPDKLRQDINLIKVVIYDPPSKFRTRDDIDTNVTGVFTVGPDIFKPAPVILYRDPKWVAPIEIAYSLVGNAVSARRQQDLIDMKQKLADIGDPEKPEFKEQMAKFKDMLAAFYRTTQALADKAKCGPLKAEFEAAKVWETNAINRDKMAKNLSSRKCW